MNIAQNKAKSVFLNAVEITSITDRQAFLDAECAGDEPLRREVDDLLLHEMAKESFLESGAHLAAVASEWPANAEGPGTVIGQYKLLQQIGEGGMGTVFMAEQTHPVHRKVAIKVIRSGMDSREVIARFEAERQALAMMDHDNIARVFEAGTTESGRPYFVMELVHGVPITTYCDDNHLTPRERLELFVPVCQAIQHAHQKGIIHRDVKPSNVMITLYDNKPVPKVIDFGVAKATEQKLTERTLFTQYGTMVGTFEYMSPEQAQMSAQGVDTRSDIYSLGVLLYELLTGTTPLSQKRIREAGYGEILRMIKEEEPPKPSTRLRDSGEALASISAQRHMEPAKLKKLVRGELDWIVMKTLEKDRNRRYETANGFAADVQRYLNDEPVHACPPSAWYRFRKFGRRNKAALVTGALVALAILIAVGSFGWIVRDRAAREEAIEGEVQLALKDAKRLESEGKYPEALSAAKRAEGLLVGDTSTQSQMPVRALRKDLEIVLKLEGIRLEQRTQLAAERPGFNFMPADRAYGEVFRELGVDVDSQQTEEAAELIRKRSIRIELAAALDDWFMLRRWQSRSKGSPSWKCLLALARAIDDDAWRNRFRDAVVREDARALMQLANDDSTPGVTATHLHLLGVALKDSGNATQAEILLRKAQQRFPHDFWVNYDLTLTLGQLTPPKWEDAVRFATVAVALRGDNAAAHNILGQALRKNGKLDEAITEFQQAIRLKPELAEVHNRLGGALRRRGKLSEAVTAYKEAIRLKPDLAEAHCYLGNTLSAQGKLAEAITSYKVAIGLEPDNIEAQNSIAWALATCADPKLRDAAEAVRIAEKVVKLTPHNTDNWNTLGVAHYRHGDWQAAIAALEKSMALCPSDYGGNIGNSINWFFLAMTYWQLGDKTQARKWYDKADQWLEKNQLLDYELLHFRDEAAALLGLPVPSKKQ